MVVVAFPMTTSAELASFPIATSTPLTNNQNQVFGSDRVYDRWETISQSMQPPTKRQRQFDSLNVETTLAVQHKNPVPNPLCYKIFGLLSRNGFLQGLVAAAVYNDSNLVKDMLQDLSAAKHFKDEKEGKPELPSQTFQRLKYDCENALLYSALYKLDESANELIRSGVDPTTVFKHLLTSILHQKSRELFVPARIMSRFPGIDFNVRNSDGMTALMLGSFIGDVDFVMFLLSRPEIDINSQHLDSGYTALHFACSSKNVKQEKIVRVLLAHPGIDVNLRSKDNATALLFSIESSASFPILSMLLNIPGIDVNSYHGKGPLVVAANLGLSGVVSLLIDKAQSLDVNQRDQLNMSALHYAILHQDSIMLMKLLSVPAINVNIQNGDGETPLMVGVTCESKYKELPDVCRTNLKRLLGFKGVLIDSADIYGETALFHAISFQSIKTVKLLLEYGADIRRSNIIGETPFMKATEELVSFKEDLEHVKSIHGISNRYVSDLEKSIRKASEIIMLLVNHGANEVSLDVVLELVGSSNFSR